MINLSFRIKEKNMFQKRLISLGCAAAMIFGLAMVADQASAQEKAPAVAAPQAKPVIAKICMSCHKAQEGSLRANFDNVAFISRSILLKIDDSFEVLRFDEKTIKVVTADKTEDADALNNIRKGHEVRIAYVEKNGIKTASLVSIKPPIEIAPEMIISTEDVEKLVALGPEKGKYTLVDSRPLPWVQEGTIPTAINIPYPAFDKMTDKLPKDRNALLVFFSNGVTCNMSPASANKAKKLGYANIKVYRDGMPEWQKRNYSVLSARSLKEAWIDKEVPAVILDIRQADNAKKGFIKGAVSLPASDSEKSLTRFPARQLKPPIIIYSDKSGDDAVNAAKTVIAGGYQNVKILTNGISGWQTANYPLESGNLNSTIVYVPKTKPGEMPIDEFKKIAAATPANVLVLDVREQDEANFGMIKGAKLLPDEKILDRLAELPKEKLIITYCSTGVRAEMAYHTLKEKGYNVKYMNANIEFDGKGNYTVEKP
jgi:rhodanese-related sulfurtransferase